MFRKRYIYLLLAVALSFVLIFSSACDSDKGELINFEDPVFYNLIKKELGKDKIYTGDLAKYTEITILADELVLLRAEGEGIGELNYFWGESFEYDGVMYDEVAGTMKSLQDLKYFSSLKEISIAFQRELDFNTIPEELYKRIEIVDIYACDLEDISFLGNFENLRVVYISTNKIYDLSPLKGKSKLAYLDFSWNEVDNLTPLSSLNSLKWLSAYGNKISDLTPLSGLTNLEEISFYENLIEDISPLKEMKTLKRVELINNQIKDVSPLKDFENFEELRLSGNPITNLEVLSHIPNLEYEAEYP